MAHSQELVLHINNIVAGRKDGWTDLMKIGQLVAIGANPCTYEILKRAECFTSHLFWDELCRHMTSEHFLAASDSENCAIYHLELLLVKAPQIFADEQCVLRAIRACNSEVRVGEVAVRLAPFITQKTFAELQPHVAGVMIGQRDIAKNLLDKGVFDVVYPHTRGIVELACKGDNRKLVIDIIDRMGSAKVLHMNQREWTLFVAACERDLYSLNILIDAHTSIPFEEIFAQFFALRVYTCDPFVRQVINKLLDRGAPVNCATMSKIARTLDAPIAIWERLISAHFGTKAIGTHNAECAPLHAYVARYEKDICEVARLFVRFGANPHLRTLKGVQSISASELISASEIAFRGRIIHSDTLASIDKLRREWNPTRVFANATHARLGTDSPAQLLAGFSHITNFIAAIATDWSPNAELL